MPELTTLPTMVTAKLIVGMLPRQQVEDLITHLMYQLNEKEEIEIDETPDVERVLPETTEATLNAGHLESSGE